MVVVMLGAHQTHLVASQIDHQIAIPARVAVVTARRVVVHVIDIRHRRR